MQKYDKLIRDKIIAIITAKGESARWHVADDTEYHAKLAAKLREEVEEFLAAESVDEMADVLEVLDAWCVYRGFDPLIVRDAQQAKRDKRGGFTERIILEES